MQNTITCKNCRQEICGNIRLKGNQRYCGVRECQNARKAEWQHQKISTTPAYAQHQQDCKKHWRQIKPAHQYQKEYRLRHPEYVENNRIQQRKRNQKPRLSGADDASEMIVKMDALPLSTEKTNTYRMIILTPGVSQKIVKMDAFIVQLEKYQGVTAELG
jgi:hypothetical protein